MGIPPIRSKFPCIQTTLSVWESTPLTPSVLQPITRLPVPIEVLQHFIPHISLMEWKQHNISHMSELMSHSGKLVPLAHLINKFSLPSRKIFGTYKSNIYGVSTGINPYAHNKIKGNSTFYLILSGNTKINLNDAMGGSTVTFHLGEGLENVDPGNPNSIQMRLPPRNILQNVA